MKRWMGLVVVFVFAALSLAQAPFTIVRPAEGAKVRETVRIQIPKGSLAEGNFVGVYVDGKFVEATILEAKGDYYEYMLDTKGSKIPDGMHKLELVKYAEAGDRARIVDRSSVTVTVANSASIKVPEDGFLLRYKWQKGKQLVYNTEVKGTINAITENQARYGGRAAELPIDTDHFRYLYAIDNSYSNGDGLIRMQVMPSPGKDYVFFKLLRSSTGEVEEGVKHSESEMYPAYMRVSTTGAERFGSVPPYIGLMSDPETSFGGWVLVLPMPALPEKAIKPGDPFPSRFQLDGVDEATMFETKTLVENLPARGEFVGVEWQSGHPCAKLHYTVSAQMLKPKAGTESKEGLGGDKISLEQTVFFAMDIGVPVKMELDFTQDGRMTTTGGGMGGQQGGMQPGGTMGPGRLGGGGVVGPENIKAGQKGPAGMGGPPRGGVPQGPGPIRGGQQPGRQGAPAGGTAQNQFMRLRIRFTQTLVQ